MAANMTSINQTSRDPAASAPARVAMTMIIQFMVLILLGWAVALYVNWSSAAAMSEFVARTTPQVSAPGEPHASLPLQPAHHRTAVCPRRA
jgi:hypothetical protein